MSDDIVERLRATVARLERVIKEYAHHRSKCNSLYYHADGNAYCDCGFDAAIAAESGQSAPPDERGRLR